MRFFRVLSVLIILSILAGTGLVWAKEAEDGCIREVWSVLKQDDNPVGFGVDQVWRTQEGYRYISDATIQLTFLGSRPSIVKQHLEMKVDSNYLAQSYLGIFDINGSRTQIKAEFSKEQVKVSTLTADGKENVNIQKIERPLYFATSFLDSLLVNNHLKVGDTYTADIWDIGTMTVLQYSLAINQKDKYSYEGKEIPVFKITEKTDHETYSVIDAKGCYYSGYDPKMKLFYYRVEKDQIPELKAMNADALLVPGNQKVSFPFRSISSQIKVKWESVDYKEFDFNDNRQKIVKQNISSGNQEVIVKINRDDRDFTGKVKLPVTNKKLAPYLADVQYITPSSPKVRKLSAEILKNEKDGWRATQKLVKWVFEYIKPEIIPETLTTEQILERKTGKCVEYAVLFASLARAAGLPTRVVLGERYQDNMWIGHLWNEVWLGEWVAVDASHNQIAPDALLLKLVASDTILGTQKVRTGLIGELGIEIIDVETEAQSVEEHNSLKTGITGQTYINADFKCRMEIPEGWKLIEAEEQGMPELIAQNPDNPMIVQVLLMFSVPQGTPAEMILTSRIPALKNALPEFSLIKEEKLNLKDYPAAVGTWEYTHAGTKYKQQNWIVVKKDRGFLLVFQAPSANWEQYQAEFQKMRMKFEILE